MSDFLKLAGRCEQATGPDRELNIAIHRIHHRFPDTWPESYEGASVTNYTASLDAAVTLVPEGCDWLARNDGRGGFANVTAADFQARVEISGGKSIDRSTGFSAPCWATPALALCAASLRAIHATMKEVGQ